MRFSVFASRYGLLARVHPCKRPVTAVDGIVPLDRLVEQFMAVRGWAVGLLAYSLAMIALLAWFSVSKAG